MPEVLQQFSEGKRRKTVDQCAVETGCGEKCVPWKDAENDGKRTIFTWDVGILSPRKKQSKESCFESRLKKKSRQGYKVSGSWNRQPENTWSK